MGDEWLGAVVMGIGGMGGCRCCGVLWVDFVLLDENVG